MSLANFVKGLQLPLFADETDYGTYIVKIENSDEFSKVFDVVSSNEHLEADDNSIANERISQFVYTDGYYEVKLTANFLRDRYMCEISER